MEPTDPAAEPPVALQELLERSAALEVDLAPRRVERVRDEGAPPAPGEPYPFQREAAARLEGERSNLLVASPTGSGKTRVISSAAALAVRRNQRLFVCEPLVALVEQIYARLRRDGLPDEAVEMRTGLSVREREGAAVTVCTYEVLATLCGARAETLVGCATVVVDELHFLDGDRGPVLQEIFDWCRQERVAVVGLSGTLPNEREVAGFLCGVNGLPTCVVGAARRPVPLQYFYYDVWRGAFSTLRPEARPCADYDAGRLGGLGGRQDVLRLARGLRAWDSLPALVVAFSCRRLDEWAEHAASADEFAPDASGLSRVTLAFARLRASVPEEDRCLFAPLEALARRGVGLHHSHLPVPYLELVSELAERRLLALVFSTSTLSAGINLPVRTVCLCGATLPRRAEGGEMRREAMEPLLFHQLAGRAGRPG